MNGKTSNNNNYYLQIDIIAVIDNEMFRSVIIKSNNNKGFFSIDGSKSGSNHSYESIYKRLDSSLGSTSKEIQSLTAICHGKSSWYCGNRHRSQRKVGRSMRSTASIAS